MELIGEIVAEPDPPGIGKQQWVELISHPCLEPGEPSFKEGVNPFTRKPTDYRSPADFAWVIVAGKRVGKMDWALGDMNLINVHGERQTVIPVARFVAETLGGTFREHGATRYNEKDVLKSYLSGYVESFMTEFERRCYRLGTMREAADASPQTPVAERFQAMWLAEGSDEVLKALADGARGIRQRVAERVLREHREGILQVNRCPQCRRIVRTPLAQQCFWCGHDWHGR